MRHRFHEPVWSLLVMGCLGMLKSTGMPVAVSTPAQGQLV
jgi:hypothetical protein